MARGRTSPRSQEWSWQSKRARDMLRHTLPTPCIRCGKVLGPDDKWSVDHVPPRAQLPTEDWLNPQYLHVSCLSCNAAAGGRMSAAARRANKERRENGAGMANSNSGVQLQKANELPMDDANGEPNRSRGGRGGADKGDRNGAGNAANAILYGPDQQPFPMGPPHRIAMVPIRKGRPRLKDRPQWWPEHLATPPETAAFPRLETEHHPEAIGTYGPEVREHAATYGVQLRWWQEFALARILEHREDGSLCWPEAAVSMARQVGKGYGLLRPLIEWRMCQRARFGDEDQTVLHIAHQLSTAMEVASPAYARGKDLGWRTVRMAGEAGIFPNSGDAAGGRWLIRSTTGAYGFSVNTAVLDEVWSIDKRTVDSMIQPMLVARSNPQLVLISTANASPTPLYPAFRDSAGLEDERLLLEWSPEPTPEFQDDPCREEYGRQAAPHWSEQRWRMMRREFGKANRTDWLANWMNVWPQAPTLTPEDMAEEAARAYPLRAWSALGVSGRDPGAGGVVAVDETTSGRIMWVRVLDGQVWYGEAANLQEAARIADSGASAVIGISTLAPLQAAGMRANAARAGSREALLSMPLLVRLVEAGQLQRPDDARLGEQMHGCALIPREHGYAIDYKRCIGEVGGVKLLAWAVGRARSAPNVSPMIW